jgi:hypothetical protein
MTKKTKRRPRTEPFQRIQIVNQYIEGNNNIQVGGDLVMGEKSSQEHMEEVALDLFIGNKRPKVSNNAMVHAQKIWRAYRENGQDYIYIIVQQRCRVDEVEDASDYVMGFALGLWLSCAPIAGVLASSIAAGVIYLVLYGVIVSVFFVALGKFHVAPVRLTKQARYERRLMEHIKQLQRKHGDVFVDVEGGEITTWSDEDEQSKKPSTQRASTK